MSFKEKKYTLIKEVVSKEIADFVYNYFLLKRKVDQKLFTDGMVSKYTPCFGTWDDPQVPNTYSCYADVVMETLLKTKTYHGKTHWFKIIRNLFLCTTL